MGQFEYNNRVELSYILDNTETEIPYESINSVSIRHDFDTSNMPAIFLSLNMEYKLYNSIVNNVGTGVFRLSIKRYNRNSVSPLKHGDISGLFTYIVPTDPEYNKTLIQTDDNSTSYKSGTVALLSLDLINGNHKVINSIIKNSNMISIVYKYTNHMNMIVEPFTNEENRETLIIPPTSTLTRLLSFLNDTEAFYDTKYRFFMDFDRSYLLSSSGVAVPDQDSEYDTVIINVLDPSLSSSNYSGFDINKSAGAYVLNISASDTSMNIDTSSDLQCNKILSFKYRTRKDILDINEEYLQNTLRNDGIDRVVIKKAETSDIKSIISDLNSSNIIMNVIRSDMDTSILTPNKEYLIKNYEDYKEYNGRYILSYKKEMMIQQGEDFVSNVIFGLRKVSE